MEIIPDPVHTALLTLPFLVALVGLHLILWKPLLAYLDARDDASAKARYEAHEYSGAAEEQLRRIEVQLGAARVKVGEVRQVARSRALGREAEIIAAARQAAEARIDEAVALIVTEQAAASASLKAQAQDLSRDIASQVLGRPVQG